jgi:pyruvate formate lyase activating enzyme
VITEAGLVKTSLVDFPGRIASTIFLPGCNLRCPYCHNPELVTPPWPADLVAIDDVVGHLRSRAHLLEGVCITGGEPTVHLDLPDLIDRIHELGLLVKLDTNGLHPERLAELRPDFVALDLKTAPNAYERLGASRGASEKLLSSIRWILDSGIDHEFRTTAVPGIVDLEDVRALAAAISGARRYVIAQFRPGKTMSADFAAVAPYPASTLYEMKRAAQACGIPTSLRGLAG